MAGRKSKYETHVLPKLFLVECWARDGLTEEQIAEKLGISYSTFKEYKNQFSAFSAALKKGKEVVDCEVENALLKKALGYTVELKKTFKVKKPIFDDEGRKIADEEMLEQGVDEVHIPPDTTAQIFWLKNRKREVWRDKVETEITGDMGLTIKVELTDE